MCILHLRDAWRAMGPLLWGRVVEILAAMVVPPLYSNGRYALNDELYVASIVLVARPGHVVSPDKHAAVAGGALNFGPRNGAGAPGGGRRGFGSFS